MYCKHGQYGTPLHRRWGSMIQRCENPSRKDYKYYGGRGIKVCPEWRKDFMAFRRWALASGHEKGLTIDRIDNEGNYEPGNCRFSTRKEQARNRKSNRYLKIGNEIKLLVEWATQAGISMQLLAFRVKAGLPEHQLLEPTRRIK